MSSKDHALIGGTGADLNANCSGCRCFFSVIKGYLCSLIAWVRTLCCCTKNYLVNIQTILVINTMITTFIIMGLLAVIAFHEAMFEDQPAGTSAALIPPEYTELLGSAKLCLIMVLAIVFATNWALWYGLVWRERPCLCFCLCWTEDGCCGMDPRRLAGNLMIFFALVEVGSKLYHMHEVHGEVEEVQALGVIADSMVGFLLGCCLRSVPNGAPGLESDVYTGRAGGAKRGLPVQGHTESSDEGDEMDSE